jgi:dienelactone hydrolase
MRQLALLPVVLLVAAAPVASSSQLAQVDAVARVESLVDALAAGRFDDVTATFDDRMRTGLPTEKLAASWVAVEQQAGRFERRIGATTRTQDQYTIVTMTCAFAQATVDVQIALDASGRVAGFGIRPAAVPPTAPPPYARPEAYVEQDVVTGAEGWPLPGTLTVPIGDGPFPAVVLVHGSGAQDRDASFGPNRIFRDIALGLASQGVAVLRYEKRPRQHGERMIELASLTVRDEVIDDAVAAVGQLRRTPRIDGSRIFVLGHSLGGMLAPRIVAADPAIAGAIVLAGAVRSLEQSIVEQTRYLIMVDGQLVDEERTQLEQAEQLAARVRALTPADAPSRELIGGAPPSYWLDLRGYDPPAAASALAHPFLVLQGERDYQVTLADFARWRAALASRANVTLRSYPDLNHMFMRGAGPSQPSDYLTPGHVDPDVVADIARWITTAVARTTATRAFD